MAFSVDVDEKLHDGGVGSSSSKVAFSFSFDDEGDFCVGDVVDGSSSSNTVFSLSTCGEGCRM